MLAHLDEIAVFQSGAPVESGPVEEGPVSTIEVHEPKTIPVRLNPAVLARNGRVIEWIAALRVPSEDERLSF
jgi:hypothetical protein